MIIACALLREICRCCDGTIRSVKGLKYCRLKNYPEAAYLHSESVCMDRVSQDHADDEGSALTALPEFEMLPGALVLRHLPSTISFSCVMISVSVVISAPEACPVKVCESPASSLR